MLSLQEGGDNTCNHWSLSPACQHPAKKRTCVMHTPPHLGPWQQPCRTGDTVTREEAQAPGGVGTLHNAGLIPARSESVGRRSRGTVASARVHSCLGDSNLHPREEPRNGWEAP